MIGWLQGRVAETWQQANRRGLLLLCQGVGYEVQLTDRHWQQLPPTGSELGLPVHLSVREDGWVLYGFRHRDERDLFRELVGISGVGPQMAMALLSCLPPTELVEAIVIGDLRSLMRAQGVGRRTAERLALELRGRLQERFPHLHQGAPVAGQELPASDSLPAAAGREDLLLTLTALGYETIEIHRALQAVAAQEICRQEDSDGWIRECLRWLSRQAA